MRAIAGVLRRVEWWPAVVVALGVTAFSAGYGALAVLRHRAFDSGRFDLGNATQAVWSTAHGHPLEVTTLWGTQASRLASHFDPILAALAPLWLVWPSAESLLSAQALAVGLGAVPVYALARKHLCSDVAGVSFAFAYLVYPPLQWLVLDDFHAAALSCPLLIAAFWALDADRLIAFAGFAGAAVLTKEEIGLVVAGMGLWYAISRGRVVPGLTVALTGAAVSVLAVDVVVAGAGGRSSAFYSRYDAVGGSARGIAATAVTHPLRLLGEAFSRHDLGYLAQLAAPLLALCLLAPLALLAALPEAALNVLSSAPTQTSIRFHYTAALTAGLFAATILGAGALVRRHPRLREWIGPAVLGAVVVANVAPGPVPLVDAASRHVDAHDRAAAAAVRLVPATAVVTTSNSVGAHLSARRRILSFPLLSDATWAVVDERRPSYLDRYDPARAAASLAAVRDDPAWRVVFDRDGIVVLRRRTTAP